MKYDDQAMKYDDQAMKYDDGKVRLDLIPVEPLIELGRVFTFGAGKYEADNWKKGLNPDRLYAALLRHLWAWRQGEIYDPESGLHHLAHVMWNAQAILYFELKSTQDARHEKH